MRLSLLFLLLLVPSTLALGVSPASQSFGPEGGSFTFKPVGAEGQFTVHAEGDLSTFITFDATTLNQSNDVHGTITIPSDLAPGEHTQQIVLTALPATANGTFAGRAEVAARLIVKIPYPDEYLDAHWDVNRDTGSGMAIITVTLENLGSIETAPSSIALRAGEQVVHLTPQPLTPRSFATSQASFTPQAPGIYDAQLTVLYSNKTLVQAKQVQLGTPKILLNRITFNDEAGSIKPIDLSGTLLWNQPLNGTAIVFFDNDTDPVYREAVQLQGAFSNRIYVQSDRAPSIVKVVLQIPGSEARAQTIATHASQERNWVVPIIICVAMLFLLLLFVYRRANQYNYKP